MKDIVKTRGINYLHRYLLMKADLLAASTIACSKRRNPASSLSSEVKSAFDKAILSASKSGFRHDAALGNELLGDFFVTIGDGFWAKYYLTKSW